MPGIGAAAGGGDGLGGVAVAAHRRHDGLGHPERGDHVVDRRGLGLGARIRSISTTGTTAAPVTASRSEDRS